MGHFTQILKHSAFLLKVQSSKFIHFSSCNLIKYFVSLKVLWNKNDLNSFENYQGKTAITDEVNQNYFVLKSRYSSQFCSLIFFFVFFCFFCFFCLVSEKLYLPPLNIFFKNNYAFAHPNNAICKILIRNSLLSYVVVIWHMPLYLIALL